MDTQDFLATADALLRLNTEAADKSAVSRAYYAAYHEARKLAGAEIPDGAGGAHDLAWRWLRDHRPRQAGDFKTLKECREQADYRLRDDLSHDRAAVLVARSKQLIRWLRTPAIEQTAEL